jgi:predicted RND superfamily exporter protein
MSVEGNHAAHSVRARLPRALVRFGARRPLATLGIWLALIAVVTPFVLRLRIETATESFLDRSDAAWKRYERSQALFGGDEIVTILLEDSEPFGRRGLGEVLRISRELEAIDGIRRVDSLATVPLVQAEPDGALSLDPALADPIPSSNEELAQLRERVQADRIAPRTTISQDERAYGVNLLFSHGTEARYAEILGRVERSLDGDDYAISGVPVFRIQVEQRVREELTRFVPLTVLCLGLLLYFAVGSVAGVALPLATSAVGVWIGAGAMSLAGRPITMVTIMLPSILLANGCAYALHVLVAGSGRRRAELEEALQDVALPVALSGATTALGFVASSMIPIEAIRDIGVFGALGVLVVNFAALTLVPALLSILELPPARRALTEGLGVRLGKAFVRWSMQRGGIVFAAWGIALVLSAVGISRLRVETDAIEWFSKKDPVRVDYQHIRDRISGISPMNVVIEARGDGSISEARVIRALEELTAYAETLPEVGRAISIADPLLQLHRGFTGDPAAPLPSDSATIEQYLLLLESKTYTRDLITADRRAANVVLRVDDNGSGALLTTAGALERWWREHGVPGFRAKTTGIMYEFARSEDTIAWGQIRGLATAFIPIAAVLFAIFRSTRLTIIALIPNVVPIAVAYGAMGLLGIPLDAGTAVLGSLALGIAVDDTIHVAEGYLTYRPRSPSAESALMQTYERSLPALCVTTGAIAIGFLVLGFSEFTFTRNLGVVTSALMLLCFAADILLFAPLLMRWMQTPAR